MSIYNTGCGAPPPPVCDACPTKELGGVRGVAIWDASYVFDTTDPAAWEAGICGGSIFLFPLTNGEVTIEANMSDGYGNLPTTLDGYTYTCTFHEPQTKNNVPFWNFVKKGITYRFSYKTQTMLWISSTTAQFTPTNPVQKDVKTKIDTEVKVMWIQSDEIVPITAPAGVFDGCASC